MILNRLGKWIDNLRYKYDDGLILVGLIIIAVLTLLSLFFQTLTTLTIAVATSLILGELAFREQIRNGENLRVDLKKIAKNKLVWAFSATPLTLIPLAAFNIGREYGRSIATWFLKTDWTVPLQVLLALLLLALAITIYIKAGKVHIEKHNKSLQMKREAEQGRISVQGERRR